MKNGNPCLCANLRSAARAITDLFNEELRASGLLITQFSTLAEAKRLEGPGIAELARSVGLERTTLTRNLKVLQSMGYVVVSGHVGKTQSVKVTKKGDAALAAGGPLWLKAQQKIAHLLGKRLSADILEIKQILDTAAGPT